MAAPGAKCPECGHAFGYFASFRIVNPFKFACPTCGTLLSGGANARRTINVCALIGGALAAVAIVMEEFGRWSTAQSLLFLGIGLPAIAIPYQWLCWRATRLERYHGPEPIPGRRASPFALLLAIIGAALLVCGWVVPGVLGRIVRVVGLALGTGIGLSALALCGYYYWRGVWTRGLAVATLLAAACVIAGVAMMGLLFAGYVPMQRLIYG